MASPVSRVLSSSQLETLAQHGEERTAAVGEELFRGRRRRPTPSSRSVEGEAAVLDGAGAEIVRHGASGFLGEMNLLSGQTVFLTAVVTEPMRYIAVEREALRRLLLRGRRRSPTCSSPPSSSAANCCSSGRGSGSRSSARAIQPRPASWSTSPSASASPTPGCDPAESESAAALLAGLDAAELPLVRLPGGGELRRPSNGELSRALGIGLELAPREEVDLLVDRRRPGRPRRRRLRRLGGPRHAGRREHRARRPGGDLAADRELPRLPGRDQRHRADQPRDHPGAQVQRAHGDALPGRARSSRAATRHLVRLEGGNEIAAKAVLLATGAEYRRLPVEKLDEYEGLQRLLRRRAAGGPALRRPAGRASSAAATRPPRRRSGWRAAAPSSPCCTAAPTSPRRCRTT